MLSRLRHLLGRTSGHYGETRVRQKEVGPRSHSKTWRNKWSWGRHTGTTGEAPSQLSTFTEQEQQMTDLEKLTIQLQSVTYEQIELRGILDNYINKDLNNRLNSLELLKREHKQVMSDLQKLPIEISEALNKCKRLIEENESYIFLNSLVLRDLTPLKKNADVLRLENRKLLEEQNGLQESCEEVKKLLKEVHEKIRDPCAEQHQEQDSQVERLKNPKKQKELVTQQRDLAENQQPHSSVSEMRSDNLQSEKEQATAQDESLLQTELLQQEH